MNCVKCGATLNEGSLFCSQCGEKVVPEKRICASCGNELKENEKFCSQCGTKYEALKCVEAENTEPTDIVELGQKKEQTEKDIVWEKVHEMNNVLDLSLMVAYDSDAVSCESIGLINWFELEDADRFRIEAPLKVLERFKGRQTTMEIPIFYFDYSDKARKTGNLEEGIIFTSEGIRGCFSTMDNPDKWRLIPYNTIQYVEHKRVLLASVMDVYDIQGKKSRFYLTGITKPENFVSCVERFILFNPDNKTENNSVSNSAIVEDITPKNEKQKEIGQEMNVEAIVRDVCAKAEFSSIYGKSSNNLQKENYAKCAKAVQNFKVPANETLYLIADCTILGSCKAGIVLAGENVYCKDGAKCKVYNWKEFVKVDVLQISGTYLKIGEDIELNVGGDMEAVLSILDEIKERLFL